MERGASFNRTITTGSITCVLARCEKTVYAGRGISGHRRWASQSSVGGPRAENFTDQLKRSTVQCAPRDSELIRNLQVYEDSGARPPESGQAYF